MTMRVLSPNSKTRKKPRTIVIPPPDIFKAVVDYVDTIYPLDGKEILRPFYPCGDYEHADYPEDGVVIDNPPFSIFTKICKFYSERNIPFFIFGPGLTIFSCLKYCSVVVVSPQIKFGNAALIKCNFATNLLGDTLVSTSRELSQAIAACPSQPQKVRLQKYAYPPEVLSVSDFQTMAKGDDDFAIKRSEATVIRSLDFHPNKSGLFGDHLLVSKAAAVKAAAVKAVPIELSERERLLLGKL